MNLDKFEHLTIAELLEQTQTNVTEDPIEGFIIATYAYEKAKTPIEKGIAARQAGFRAEQANESPEIVEEQFQKSRQELSSNDPLIKRELIATELLAGRALALRIEKTEQRIGNLVMTASKAFENGEDLLKEQHEFGQHWDRFGTMLARHRATHEAMNGSASFATIIALSGIWRAIRAKNTGTPEEHKIFVKKQVQVNLASGLLAISGVVNKTTFIQDKRHKLALKLLEGNK